MPPKSVKGNEREIDLDLTEADPDLIDADGYAVDDEQQAGLLHIFYCNKCGDHLDGRPGPFCMNCEDTETQESWQARDRRLRDNEAYNRAKEAGICCHCRQRQADPGHSSCTPCGRRKDGNDHVSRRKAKGRKRRRVRRRRRRRRLRRRERVRKRSRPRRRTRVRVRRRARRRT